MEIIVNPDIPTPTKLKNGNSKKLSINIKRFGAMITRPRQVFTEINDENHKLADWKSPIIIVGLIIIVAGLLMVTNTTSTSSSQASSSSSGFSLDFSSLATGGMQGGGPMGMGGPNQTNNNAITIDESTATDTNGQATTSSSTLLSRVLSALGGLVSFLLTWLLLGSLINLLAISFGGQANTKMAIVFAAWTCVPLGVRALMQILYLFASGSSINAVGLSGFVPSTTTTGTVFLQKLLSQVDIYLIWQMVLLVFGLNLITKLDTKKSILVAVSTVVLVVLLKSLLGLGIDKLSNLSINSSILGSMIR